MCAADLPSHCGGLSQAVPELLACALVLQRFLIVSFATDRALQIPCLAHNYPTHVSACNGGISTPWAVAQVLVRKACSHHQQRPCAVAACAGRGLRLEWLPHAGGRAAAAPDPRPARARARLYEGQGRRRAPCLPRPRCRRVARAPSRGRIKELPFDEYAEILNAPRCACLPELRQRQQRQRQHEQRQRQQRQAAAAAAAPGTAQHHTHTHAVLGATRSSRRLHEVVYWYK